ncbi:MAG: extracellular solute-binding protein [Eubacteriales bacterium]
MKKVLALLLSFVLMVGALSACGKEENTEVPQSEEAVGKETETVEDVESEVEKEEVTLRYVTMSTIYPQKEDEINEALQKVLPHITLEIVHIADNYETTVKSQFATGDAPDLFEWTGYTAFEPFVEAGYVVDITDTGYVDNVLEPFQTAGMYQDKVYGIPTIAQSFGLIYNVDAFEKAGIEESPKTLTELKDVCEKLKAVDIIPFATGFKEVWVGNQMSWKFLTSTIGEPNSWYDSMVDGTGSFKTEESDQAFELLDIVIANTVDMPLSSDAANMSYQLGVGEAAMMFLGEFQYDAIAKSNPEVHLAMAPTPVSENPEDAFMEFDGQQIVFLSEMGEHQEEALEVLGWMVSEDGARTLSTVSGQSSALNYELPDVEINPLGASGAEYILSGGKTTSLIKNYWPSGMTTEAGKAIQDYIAGTYDKEQFFVVLDEAFERLSNPE